MQKLSFYPLQINHIVQLVTNFDWKGLIEVAFHSGNCANVKWNFSQVLYMTWFIFFEVKFPNIATETIEFSPENLCRMMSQRESTGSSCLCEQSVLPLISLGQECHQFWLNQELFKSQNQNTIIKMQKSPDYLTFFFYYSQFYYNRYILGITRIFPFLFVCAVETVVRISKADNELVGMDSIENIFNWCEMCCMLLCHSICVL